MQEQEATTLFDTRTDKIRRRRQRHAMKPVFKQGKGDNALLFPETLDERIGEGDVVRYINTVIEKMDTTFLYEEYKGGGTSAYDPVVMLKILLASYSKKIYTSRNIAKGVREVISLMWIAKKQTPDFRTIAKFRSGRLKEKIEQVFATVLQMMIEEGYISVNECFVDGTKLRADANKYKVVWKKNAHRYKERVITRINEYLKEIDEAEKKEEEEYGDKNLPEEGEGKIIDPEKIRKRLEEIKKENESNQKDQAVKKKLKLIKKIEKEELPKIDKYNAQIETAGKRSGYSTTDPDASIHRMKDGRLLPSYNAMITTSGQYVLNVTVGQNPADTALFIPHMKQYNKSVGNYPETIVGDAGFGSEENYAYLEENRIENYLKYNTFYREEKSKFTDSKHAKDRFRYEEEKDRYICPEGRELPFVEEQTVVTDIGYKSRRRRYRCVDCSGCPVASSCKKGVGNKVIDIRPALERYKKQARENLTSDRGKELRKRRNIEPETFNGDLKHNQGFRRVHLRGIEKVKTEVTIMALAYNFRKIEIAMTQN